MYHCVQNITSNLSRILAKGIIKKLLQARNVNILHSMNQVGSCFEGVEDRYRGITVDSSKENCSSAEFASKLEESLKRWTEHKNRGIWFKVGKEHAEWVPILVNKGFEFHHANAGYVMLLRWLPAGVDACEGDTCNVPGYAHTMLGVGAVVTNEKGQVLVVQERHWIGPKPQWKFPGGVVEAGEELGAAAVREVREETGVEGEFETLVCWRHAAKGIVWNCGDLYAVLGLRALTNEVKPCPREISAACWMEPQEFLAREDVSPFNKLVLQRRLELRMLGLRIECRTAVHPILLKRYETYSITSEQDTTVTNSSSL